MNYTDTTSTGSVQGQTNENINFDIWVLRRKNKTELV